MSKDFGGPRPEMTEPEHHGGNWVDDLLLHADHEDTAPAVHIGERLDRATLRRRVRTRHAELTESGLRSGGAVALQLPPSLALLTDLLAAWRAGAQVVLLDHRLTGHETDRALRRVTPQFVVRPAAPVRSGALRGFHAVDAVVEAYPDGRPAATGHALVQLSSGSTGPSKVIGRTAEDLVAEVHRYTRIPGMPRPGERIVVLNSLVHAMGLMAGLLHSLHAGVEIVLPERMTADGILTAVAARGASTVITGVPFHAQLLASVSAPPALPHLVRAITAGESVRPGVAEAFTARFGVPLGEVYGMTETGVIAADLSGANRPATGWAAPGIDVKTVDGELLVRRPVSPYLGLTDPDRWSDGWLRTRDAATLDPQTGLLGILGRLDSQVSVGGLKVDLTEVELTLSELPGVREAVVVHDGAIEAYAVLDEEVTARSVESLLAERVAGFKLPRRIHPVTALPRTTTGKPVRDPAALRATALERM
ncbi:long-chain fatty acid--CoA ligase [Streptomyces sp. ISL-66]|uniref:class I adenylate-forming enzyme family protein n=1 Tax=Streptomyces sp. ISL-66 TaxID=2819186 RepID=UPI001BEC7979|nr:fatty acid--CoA ligase family protein [Streptomyces sp. ISL-66]MBT2472564.1 long-chain fatty acid--CoA ligase [Streptomyces sp. ISL-66]